MRSIVVLQLNCWPDSRKCVSSLFPDTKKRESYSKTIYMPPLHPIYAHLSAQKAICHVSLNIAHRSPSTKKAIPVGFFHPPPISVSIHLSALYTIIQDYLKKKIQMRCGSENQQQHHPDRQTDNISMLLSCPLYGLHYIFTWSESFSNRKIGYTKFALRRDLLD